MPLAALDVFEGILQQDPLGDLARSAPAGDQALSRSEGQPGDEDDGCRNQDGDQWIRYRSHAETHIEL